MSGLPEFGQIDTIASQILAAASFDSMIPPPQLTAQKLLEVAGVTGADPFETALLQVAIPVAAYFVGHSKSPTFQEAARESLFGMLTGDVQLVASEQLPGKMLAQGCRLPVGKSLPVNTTVSFFGGDLDLIPGDGHRAIIHRKGWLGFPKYTAETIAQKPFTFMAWLGELLVQGLDGMREDLNSVPKAKLEAIQRARITRGHIGAAQVVCDLDPEAKYLALLPNHIQSLHRKYPQGFKTPGLDDRLTRIPPRTVTYVQAVPQLANKKFRYN
jgi:hypothetical protein